MKKIIQILSIVILISILALILIFVFNPFNLRTNFIGDIINGYLSITMDSENSFKTDKDASGNETSTDDHPLLNEEQKKTLEEYGVDISRLPSNISPEMEACFVEKLGKERANEIVKGDSPTATEVFKASSCLGE